MSDNNMKPLCHVYTEDNESCHSLIIKHYPVKWREDDVQKFLSWVIREDVDLVCIPDVHCDVAVVVLPETQLVYDTQLQRWQDKAFRRPPENCFPIFELLGEPSGIFIANLPAGISCDTLALYFEACKSGGVEGTVVEPIEEGDIAGKKYAVITINDRQAIKSIVYKQDHEINGCTLDISPFYPSVHRYILETLKKQGNNDESMSNPTADPEFISENSGLLFGKDLSDSEKSEPYEPETYNKKVNIIYPDDSLESVDNDMETARSHCTSADRGTRWFSDEVNTDRRIVGTVKPLVRASTQQKDTGDNSFEDLQVTKSSFTEEDVDCPPYKIELLISNRFKETYESETLKITLKPEKRKVSFRWCSFDEFKTIRNKMLSSFDDICSKVMKLDLSKYKLVSRESNMDWFRSKFEQKNIRVSLVTDDTKNEIICYSLNDRDVDKGIKLIEEYIVSITIEVQEVQRSLLYCEGWFELKQSIEDDKTVVYTSKDSKSICIVSLDFNKGGEAKSEIVSYLSQQNFNKGGEANSESVSYLRQQSVVKKLATVCLDSGKARCFKEYIEDKLRKEIEKRNGTLREEEKSKSPLKVQVSCEGPDEVKDLLTKTVNDIWHERIDFNKLSTSEDDIGLTMKTLGGQDGKSFISKFEQKNNCCIEISKKGEKIIQKPRVVVKDVFDSSDEESSGAAASNDRLRDDCEEETQRSYSTRGRDRRKHKGDRFNAFKSGLTEEEELQKVLEMSRESSTSPIQEVSSESDSNSMFADEAIYSDDKEVERQDGTLYDRLKSRNEYCRPKERRNNPVAGTITISGTTIKLVKGPIAKQKADILVNFVSSSQSPFDGVIARSFQDIGGKDLVEMYAESERGTGNNIVITKSSGLLQCSSVFHVKLIKTDDCGKVVKRVVSESLLHCQQLRKEDIAFPALGIGKMFRYKPVEVAQAMLSEIRVQLSTRITRLKNISIVIYGDDIYDIFQKELEALRTNEHDHRGDRSSDHTFNRHKDQHPQQRRGHGRQGHTASRHHRGARSSSNSSSNSRESSDRPRRYSDPQKGNDHSQVQRQDSHPQTEKCTVPDLSVRIIAENKDACINARKEFCWKIKNKFLYEETVDKTQKLSKSSKSKIVQIISANNITCIRGKNNFKLKGMKKNVRTAHEEILKVLLAEKNDVEHKRKLKHRTKRETFSFVNVMCEEEPEAPNYWKNYKEGETFFQSFKRLVGRKCERVELDKSSKQFRRIEKMMTATFDHRLVGKGSDAAGLDNLGYHSLIVLKIERLENFVLYEKYVKRRQKLYRKLLESKEARFPKLEQIPKCSGPIVTSKYVQDCLDGDLHPEINEYMLFHSTKKECVNVICNDGFDPRLGNGQAMFGPGIYGAEKASKADQYADERTKRTNGPLKMFLIRMMLGNGYMCTSTNPVKYPRPPCTNTRCERYNCIKPKHSGKFGHFYDSVIGDSQKLFREFVVYEDSLCYPEYLITYERR